MDQVVNYVTIAVNDFASELAFYRNVLGWEPYQTVDDTVAFFNAGGVVFSLCSLEELADDIGAQLKTDPHLGVTLSQNLPNEQAVDLVFAQVEKAGGTVVKKPQKASWGGYSGYFSDLEGHLWEIAYNPSSKFNERGEMVVPRGDPA